MREPVLWETVRAFWKLAATSQGILNWSSKLDELLDKATRKNRFYMGNQAFIVLFIVTMLNLFGCKLEDKNTTYLSENKLPNSYTDSISIEGRKIPVQMVLGDYIGFRSDDELLKFADLVVIGKPVTNLDETSFISYSESESRSKKSQGNESIVIENNPGNISQSYSIVPFRVQKYLKGALEENQIDVLQPVAYVRDKNNPPYILLQESYSPLQKYSRYILFLKEIDTITYPNFVGIYGIMSASQGKFNMDKSDQKESELERKNGEYRQLKEKVRKRYEADFNSTPDS